MDLFNPEESTMDASGWRYTRMVVISEEELEPNPALRPSVLAR
jgi:hypothetical protein